MTSVRAPSSPDSMARAAGVRIDHCSAGLTMAPPIDHGSGRFDHGSRVISGPLTGVPGNRCSFFSKERFGIRRPEQAGRNCRFAGDFRAQAEFPERPEFADRSRIRRRRKTLRDAARKRRNAAIDHGSEQFDHGLRQFDHGSEPLDHGSCHRLEAPWMAIPARLRTVRLSGPAVLVGRGCGTYVGRALRHRRGFRAPTRCRSETGVPSRPGAFSPSATRGFAALAGRDAGVNTGVP